MSEITTANEQVVSDAKALFASHYKHRIPEEAACLLWTAATIAACHKHGIRAALQAGTTMFRMVHPSNDDGLCNDHFSYKFVPQEAIGHMMMGRFPEMHCWAYLPDQHEIVDLTLGFQPAQCKKLTGMEWDSLLTPEDVLWRSVEELDNDPLNRVIYQADPLAISMAVALLKQFHGR